MGGMRDEQQGGEPERSSALGQAPLGGFAEAVCRNHSLRAGSWQGPLEGWGDHAAGHVVAQHASPCPQGAAWGV